MSKKIKILQDDTKESLRHIVINRLPWLILGLLLGISTSFVVANFQKILEEKLSLAFFVPLIVYISDAVGTQTETIYIRALQKSHIKFLKYITREAILGVCLGIIFGTTIGVFAFYWLHAIDVALTVGLAMFVNVTLAPILATLIPAALYKESSDPALGSGPIATVIQDFISLLIYFLIASFIIF